MALANVTSRAAVMAAIGEYDVLGREAFLRKYGFGRAQRYFLVHEGKHYDSKAIVGVAHGHQFPQEGTLQSKDFSGGDQTVREKLEELGFTVLVLPEAANDKSPVV